MQIGNENLQLNITTLNTAIQRLEEAGVDLNLRSLELFVTEEGKTQLINDDKMIDGTDIPLSKHHKGITVTVNEDLFGTAVLTDTETDLYVTIVHKE